MRPPVTNRAYDNVFVRMAVATIALLTGMAVLGGVTPTAASADPVDARFSFDSNMGHAFGGGWEDISGNPIYVSVNDGVEVAAVVGPEPDQWSLHGVVAGPGDTVKVRQGSYSTELLVTAIEVNFIDSRSDIISGVAPDGPVYISPGQDDMNSLTVQAVGGQWTADFSGTYDITTGTGGFAAVQEPDGDETRWHMQASEVTVDPVTDEVFLNGWPEYWNVHLEIDLDADGDVDHDVWTQPDEFGNGYHDFYGVADIVVGSVVVASEIQSTKTLIVTELTVDPPQPDSTLISGTAAPYSEVCIDVFGEGEICLDADINGFWGHDPMTQGAGAVAQYDADADATQVQLSGSPWFLAHPQDQKIWGHSFRANSQVNVLVGSTDYGFFPTDRSGYFYTDDGGLAIPLQPEDVVTVSDGTVVKSHVVTDMTVSGADDATDEVWGTGTDGRVVWVGVHGDDPGEPASRNAAVIGTTWTTDFGDLGMGGATWDIVPGDGGFVHEYDTDGDATAADWRVARDASIAVFPDDDRIQVEGGWEHGLELVITIDDDQDPTNGVLHSETISDFQGDFGFDLEFDIRRGQWAAADNGVDRREHQVTDLYVNGYDLDLDTVVGSAAPGSEVIVQVGGSEGQVDSVRFVIAGSDLDDGLLDDLGPWSANFAVEGTSEQPDAPQGVFDIPPGAHIVAEQRTGGGETDVSILVPSPRFWVDPFENSVGGEQWPEGAVVTVSLYADADPEAELLHTIDSDVERWGEQSWEIGFQTGDFGYDIEQGDWVTVEYGSTVKGHEVVELRDVALDPEAAVVSGMTAAATWVNVNAGNEFEWAWRDVEADGAGYFAANLAEPLEQGEPGDGVMAAPLVANTGGSVQIFDVDGDATFWRFCHECDDGGDPDQPQLMLVSRLPDGSQGTTGELVVGDLSGDGTVIAFRTEGDSNYFPGDTNGVDDVYVLDWRNGVVTRISEAPDGNQTDGRSGSEQLNGDGSLVAFWSMASNLIDNDTNGLGDDFIYDMASGVTDRITVAHDGSQTNAPNYGPRINADGSQVAFFSDASNLVAGDTNGVRDVFVRDLNLGTNERIAPPGDQANGHSGNDLAISADGRYVAFSSHATNLVPGDTNGVEDVFAYDRETGEIVLASVDVDGLPANGASSYASAISEDGRFVLFQSTATDLVPGDTNGVLDVFVRDLHENITTRVSVAGDGSEGNGASTASDMTPDGRVVTFYSAATNLVDGDDNGELDTFAYDTHSGTLFLLSHTEDGTPGAGQSWNPMISDDGSLVAFSSEAPDLVPDDANGTVADIFVYQLGTDQGGGGPFNFFNEGDLLVSDTSGRLWAYGTSDGSLNEYPLPFGGNFDIQYLDSSTLLIASHERAAIDMLDLASGNVETFQDDRLDQVIGIAVDHDRDFIYLADESDGVWGLEMGTTDLTLLAAGSADGIAVGPDGWVYYTQDGNRIERLDPTTDPVPPAELVADLAGYQANGLTFDHDGHLVVASMGWGHSSHAAAVLRVDPLTGEFHALYEGEAMRSPEDVAVAADGTVYISDTGWVNEFGSDPGLYRLDPTSGDLTELWRGDPLGDLVDLLIAQQPPESEAERPRFSVRMGDQQVHGYQWTAGLPVGLTIVDPDNGEVYQAYATPESADGDENQTFVWFAPLEEEGPEILPGFEITMMQGDLVTSHTVSGTIEVTRVDPDYDIVSGKARPGAPVEVHIHDTEVRRSLHADANGEWAANFTTVGSEPWEKDLFDIELGTLGEVAEVDDYDNNTQIEWGVANPTFSVEAPFYVFSTNQDWELGDTVTVTVNDEDFPGPVSATVVASDDDPSNHGWWIDLSDINFEIVPGHVVTVSDQETTKTLTVVDLIIDEIDATGDTVAGQVLDDLGAPVAGVPVEVNVDNENGHAHRTAISDTFGSWVADFSQPGEGEGEEANPFEIVPNTGVSAQVYDDDWDSTQSGDCYECDGGPFVQVYSTTGVPPITDLVIAQGFRDGVSLTIEREGVTYSEWPDPFNEGGEAWVFVLYGAFDILPGDLVTVSDGTSTIVHEVTALAVTSIDDAGHTISGVARPNHQIQFNMVVNPLSDGGEAPIDLTIETGSDGLWSVDLDIYVSFGPDGFAGSHGNIYDSDDDQPAQTTLDWWVEPTLQATLNACPVDDGAIDSLAGYGWILGETVDVVVTDETGGFVADWSGEVAYECSGGNCNSQGGWYLDTADLGVPLSPGMTITASQWLPFFPEQFGLAGWERSIVVGGIAPEITSFAGPVEPVPIDVPVEVVGSFVDANQADGHEVAIDWGDGSDSEDISDGVLAGTVNPSHQYSEPGVYTLALSVADNCGFVATMEYQYVVVYDPDGGFVTGGGWIESPEGAYAPDPTLTGQANFGFVSKYKKGAHVPTGNTEFQFHAGDLNFHSSEYDWLVVAGAKAMFKGTGAINGDGEYGFMISAIDAAKTPSTEVDLFRIKIWDMATDEVVYDNQMGDDDDADAATEIAGGNIVVHDGKKVK